VNSQPQTCLGGKGQTFLKLNHYNLCWRRSASYYNMHLFSCFERSVLYFTATFYLPCLRYRV